MTFRATKDGMDGFFRGILDRLDRLERTIGQSRLNTIHLGKWVIEPEGDKRLKMTNLETKEVTYVGDQYIPYRASKEWSWAGTVAPSVDTIAPALAVPDDITLTHITVQLWTASSTDYTIETWTDKREMMEFSDPVGIHTITLPAGQRKVTAAVDIDIPADYSFYPKVLASSGTGTELSVTYWYTGIYNGEM